MVGILGIIINIAAVIRQANGHHWVVLPIALAVALLNAVSFLGMIRFANQPTDPWTKINFLTFFAGIILIIFA